MTNTNPTRRTALALTGAGIAAALASPALASKPESDLFKAIKHFNKCKAHCVETERAYQTAQNKFDAWENENAHKALLPVSVTAPEGMEPAAILEAIATGKGKGFSGGSYIEGRMGYSSIRDEITKCHNRNRGALAGAMAQSLDKAAAASLKTQIDAREQRSIDVLNHWVSCTEEAEKAAGLPIAENEDENAQTELSKARIAVVSTPANTKTERQAKAAFIKAELVPDAHQFFMPEIVAAFADALEA